MGEQQMQDLTFYNAAATVNMLKGLATQMAHMLTVYIGQYYTQQRESAYAAKSTAAVVSAIASVLATPNKTVLDLANTVDAIYRFASEGTATAAVASIAADVKLTERSLKRLHNLGIV
ncbi:hypothetical protein E4K72_11120 [Oxalobacteraceae bacterium OM1]|nr:hypothetical protein E4K72_11120 [Oxalobacteraceae bacterium OM1]